MSGYYPPNQNIPPHHYYNPNSHLPPDLNSHHVPPAIAPDRPYPLPVPESPVYHPVSAPFTPFSDPSPHLQQPFLAHYQDPSVVAAAATATATATAAGTAAVDSAQDPNARTRRRPNPGDHVKHRRTRSGCYTCRSRRVKCDEAHPICERCRKGNRECVYPEAQSNQRTGRSGSKSGKSSHAEGSSPEDQDDDARDRLPAILDDDEEDDEEEMETDSKVDNRRETSGTPALTLDRSPSPYTETSSKTPSLPSGPPVHRKGSLPATKPPTPGKPALRPDIQFYLDYFKTHMSAHHYSLKHDNSKFFKTEYIEHALKYPPLLYALVGYAAYFHTLTQPNARMQTFLRYYDESISRLRANMMKNKKQGLPTLLTILQLAAIEEVLGDWVNLMGHHKAAKEMLTQLYDTESITQSPFLLKVILWYCRFDLYVGLQSASEAMLSRDWYVAVHAYYQKQVGEHPNDLAMRYDERFAHSRLVAKDVSDFFFKKGKGLMSDAEFMEELPKLGERVHSLETDIDPILLDPKHRVPIITGTPDPQCVVNPFEPNLLFDEAYWTSNYLQLDIWGIIFMYNLSISMTLQQPFDPEIIKKAYRSVQVFEAIRVYPHSPPGAIIEAQSSFTIATIFLSKDPKTTQWCRKSLAKIESAGYIYPATLRNKFLEGWGATPSDWWLPDDEDCPPIIRSIKDFILERTTAPKDEVSQNLQDMRGIFGSLTISDSPPDDTSSNTTEDTAPGMGHVAANIEDMLYFQGTSLDHEYGYESKFAGTEGDGSGYLP